MPLGIALPRGCRDYAIRTHPVPPVEDREPPVRTVYPRQTLQRVATAAREHLFPPMTEQLVRIMNQRTGPDVRVRPSVTVPKNMRGVALRLRFCLEPEEATGEHPDARVLSEMPLRTSLQPMTVKEARDCMSVAHQLLTHRDMAQLLVVTDPETPPRIMYYAVYLDRDLRITEKPIPNAAEIQDGPVEVTAVAYLDVEMMEERYPQH